MSCYRIRLIPASHHKTQCELFDRNYEPVGFDLVPMSDDELLARASRADRPIRIVEIVVHLPEELGDVWIGAASGSGGTRMTPAELLRYAAPAGFVTLGWKGEHVPPNTLFGCNLVRRRAA